MDGLIRYDDIDNVFFENDSEQSIVVASDSQISFLYKDEIYPKKFKCINYYAGNIFGKWKEFFDYNFKVTENSFKGKSDVYKIKAFIENNFEKDINNQKTRSEVIFDINGKVISIDLESLYYKLVFNEIKKD